MCQQICCCWADDCTLQHAALRPATALPSAEEIDASMARSPFIGFSGWRSNDICYLQMKSKLCWRMAGLRAVLCRNIPKRKEAENTKYLT